MLKDNHLAAAGGVERAMELVRDHAPHTLRVEVEVESLEQTQAALDAGAEIIMLDNMSQETMREAVALIRAQSDTVLIEASGNMTLERLGGLQGLGLDFISVGALTHSVKAADISMKLALS
jgi:nicotinate-nucleotide pyrophosphorylase (carboxylating)